jgi:hypothetical protein
MLLYSNVCLRYAYKLRQNRRESTFEIKSVATKKDTIIRFYTM